MHGTFFCVRGVREVKSKAKRRKREEGEGQADHDVSTNQK
jgi:hypothetical protein